MGITKLMDHTLLVPLKFDQSYINSYGDQEKGIDDNFYKLSSRIYYQY